MFNPFQLPNELLISSLCSEYPCREPQIRALATLLSPQSPSPKNIVLYGHTATGKSAITRALLAALSDPPSSTLTNGDNSRVRSSATNAKLRYAFIKSVECITGRHLLESTVGAVAEAVEWEGSVNRCENLAQLGVELGRMLENRGGDAMDVDGDESRRFVVVFDGVDAQRDAPPTLLPALAKMGDLIPNLTTVFIVTAPRPHFLSTAGAPYIHFPSYTKAEALTILSLHPPSIYPDLASSPELSTEENNRIQKDSKDVWIRFCTAVWDTLAKHSGRDIISFRAVCDRLWPAFTEPLRNGTFAPKDFHRLLVANRPLLQDGSILVPSIISFPPPTMKKSNPTTASTTGSSSTIPHANSPPSSRPTAKSKTQHQHITIATQLPHTSRLLLIASYLASYTPARHDPTIFSQSHRPSGGSSSTPRKRAYNKGSATSTPTKIKSTTNGAFHLETTHSSRSKVRKINRKLLGPQAFVLERMLAIFHAVKLNSDYLDCGRGGGGGRGGVTSSADLLMAFATLASLRLVVKTSAVADALDASTKWKVNVGWEVVRGLGRSVGVEVEDFVID